jgi:5-methylthioadenosine/S-adenosylhomocysteine deaminase
MGSIIIKNGFLLTMDKRNPFIPDGLVEITGDRITYVGPQSGKTTSNASATPIDAKGNVVMPGLINGHTHLCQTFGRTVGFEVNINEWLNQRQYPIMDQMGDHEYYLATMIGCLENIKNGNTTVVNNICSSHKGGLCADEPTVRAFRETGLRGFLALAYADQNHYPNAIEKREEIVARCRDIITRYHKSEEGRLRVLIGPEQPWGCSREMLLETGRLSETFDVGIHMHSNENKNWLVQGKEVHGLPTNSAIFRKYGCLGPRTILACMRVVTDEDIVNITETGASVVFDPTTALNWGTGLPPIPQVLRSGIRAGLGTNGAASNFGQDMFETMKNAIGVSRTVDGSTRALPLGVALEMATISNAEILGLGSQIGSLEVGKKADIITVRLDKCQNSPCINILAATVLSASGRDVEDVIVDGKIVMRKGKVLEVDEASIVEEANLRALACARKANLDPHLLPLS